MALSDSVVRNSPIQVQPIVVVWKVSIDFLKQQVCAFRGNVREVRIILREGHVPLHMHKPYLCPPWAIYVPVPFLVVFLLLL